MPTPTALYRLYDEGHQLLYVGITTNPSRRFREHEERVTWWNLVHDAVVGPWLSTGREAYEVEREVQRGEYPLYNAGWTVRGTRTPPAVYDDSAARKSIAAHVRDGIRSGLIEAGRTVHARQLSEKFGCSAKTAVRAMSDLQRQLIVDDRGAGRYRVLSEGDQEAATDPAPQDLQLRELNLTDDTDWW